MTLSIFGPVRKLSKFSRKRMPVTVSNKCWITGKISGKPAVINLSKAACVMKRIINESDCPDYQPVKTPEPTWGIPDWDLNLKLAA